jgi:hypothetical protein
MLLIKIVGDEIDEAMRTHKSDHPHGHGARPQWTRVIAMEIMHGYVFFPI